MNLSNKRVNAHKKGKSFEDLTSSKNSHSTERISSFYCQGNHKYLMNSFVLQGGQIPVPKNT